KLTQDYRRSDRTCAQHQVERWCARSNCCAVSCRGLCRRGNGEATCVHSHCCRISGGSSLHVCDVPGILALERLVEVKDVREVVARILWLTDEQAKIDQGKDNVSNVTGATHTPMIEHHARCEAETL